jgi:PmbA protein
VQRLVERAVAMAALAPEDPYADLAPGERLWRGEGADLDLYDASEPSAEALEDRARRRRTRPEPVPGVSNSDGGSASWASSRWRLVTSAGFDGPHRTSGFSVSASAIAQDADGMERAGDGRSTRHEADLPDPASIGEEAGRRAVARLGGRKIESTTAAVVFENRVAMSLIGPMIGAISGPAVARGRVVPEGQAGPAAVRGRGGRRRGPVSAAGARVGSVRRRGGGEDRAQAGRRRGADDLAAEHGFSEAVGAGDHGACLARAGGTAGRVDAGLHLSPGTLDWRGLMREAGTGLWSLRCSGRR